MGKSSGSAKGGGGGSAAAIVENAGGLLAGAGYNRDPSTFKSFENTNEAFRGATAKEANQIALGKMDVKVNTRNREKRLPPVEVEIYTNKQGRHEVTLIDGRHRATSAKAAGATHIRAVITRSKAGDSWQAPAKEYVRYIKL